MFYWSISPKKSKPLLLVQERVRRLNSGRHYDNIYWAFTIYRCSGGHLNTSFQLLLTKTLWGIIISRTLKLGHVKYLAKVTQWLTSGSKNVSSGSSTSELTLLTSMVYCFLKDEGHLRVSKPFYMTCSISCDNVRKELEFPFYKGKITLRMAERLKIDHLLLTIETPVLALPIIREWTWWKMQLGFFWDKLILFLNFPCVTAICSNVLNTLKEKLAYSPCKPSVHIFTCILKMYSYHSNS